MAKETILVVDDGEENREFVVEYILKPNQFQPLTAKDGQEGLKMAVSHKPDLILLDLQMPRMTGREMVEAMNERNLNIPVVLMTFHGSEEIAIEMYRMGVKDYIKKPYSVDEMLAAIERSLGEARLRQEKERLMERLVQKNMELHQRVQELNILYKMGKLVTSTVDDIQLLPQIVDAATQVTSAEEGYLYLVTDNGELMCRAMKRHNQGGAALTNDSVDNPAALHVFKNGGELLATSDQFGDYANKPRSAAFAALTLKDQVVGVLGVQNRSSNMRDFTPNDSALLGAMADYAAIAVGNSQNFRAVKEEGVREKEKIRGTFERFVAPSVVERALANPEGLEVGGHRQEISVVFADIRGFTAWSEQSSPERVMEMLNDYLSLAAELVLAWEGTLDKYFGDGLMAIFNAPEAQPNHVHRATDAALALLKAATEMNERKGYGLSYSVGVNVGEAVVGYVGTGRAMNYTAIGDVVNLAKRLQENATPGQILVSEDVVKQLGRLAHGKRLGEMRVRNRQQPVRVFQITGLDPLS